LVTRELSTSMTESRMSIRARIIDMDRLADVPTYWMVESTTRSTLELNALCVYKPMTASTSPVYDRVELRIVIVEFTMSPNALMRYWGASSVQFVKMMLEWVKLPESSTPRVAKRTLVNCRSKYSTLGTVTGPNVAQSVTFITPRSVIAINCDVFVHWSAASTKRTGTQVSARRRTTARTGVRSSEFEPILPRGARPFSATPTTRLPNANE
jgi:hypothetical protein